MFKLFWLNINKSSLKTIMKIFSALTKCAKNSRKCDCTCTVIICIVVYLIEMETRLKMLFVQ